MMNETYSPSTYITCRREVAERFDTGEEKVGTSPHGSEGRQSGDFLADWTLGNFKFECTVLVADDRITFVAEFVKVSVVSQVLIDLDESSMIGVNAGRSEAQPRSIGDPSYRHNGQCRLSAVPDTVFGHDH